MLAISISPMNHHINFIYNPGPLAANISVDSIAATDRKALAKVLIEIAKSMYQALERARKSVIEQKDFCPKCKDVFPKEQDAQIELLTRYVVGCLDLAVVYGSKKAATLTAAEMGLKLSNANQAVTLK
jgi:hypothetical protein